MSSLNTQVKSSKTKHLTFSRDVAPDLRHRCRNPRCRCKLPEPTSIFRNAFCCRGCFTGFFRSRCLVCEQPFERKQENQATCRQPKCRAALRREPAHFLGKWGTGSGTLGEAEQALGNPVNTGIKTAHKTGRAWHQVAGLPMSPSAIRLATIGAEAIRLEREQRAALEAHLHAPDPVRAAQRATTYAVTVKRFRDRGYGRPVAVPEVRNLVGCNWEPCKHPAEDFPDIPPEFRRRKESTS
jgi:hypothetical protein